MTNSTALASDSARRCIGRWTFRSTDVAGVAEFSLEVDDSGTRTLYKTWAGESEAIDDRPTDGIADRLMRHELHWMRESGYELQTERGLAVLLDVSDFDADAETEATNLLQRDDATAEVLLSRGEGWRICATQSDEDAESVAHYTRAQDRAEELLNSETSRLTRAGWVGVNRFPINARQAASAFL